MEPFRKYAFLPDVDEAPDVYETFASVAPSTARAPRSPSPETDHSDEETRDKSGLIRQRLRPDQARGIFKSSRVETDGVDFSDRINGRRVSYRVRSSKRRRDGLTPDDERRDSSDEEPETVESKIARLLREVEEVKGAIGNIDSERPNNEETSAQNNRHNLDTVLEISSALREVQLRTRLRRDGTDSTGLNSSIGIANGRHVDILREEEAPVQSSTPSDVQKSTDRVLAKATDLESRLSSLETAIGSTDSLLLSDAPTNTTRSVVTSLSILEAQFATLSTASVTSLETLSDQIEKLTKDAARLEETRNAATRAAEAALKARSLGIKPASASTTDAAAVHSAPDLELVAKIDALYATLPTIEAVTPLLPAVIERLKTLRLLHADAATAEERLVEIEQRQSRMSNELGAWREGLEKVEGLIKENDSITKGNMAAVEAWVQELEQRMKILE